MIMSMMLTQRLRPCTMMRHATTIRLITSVSRNRYSLVCQQLRLTRTTASSSSATATPSSNTEQLQSRIAEQLKQHQSQTSYDWKWYHRVIGLTARRPTLIRNSQLMYNQLEAAAAEPALIQGTSPTNQPISADCHEIVASALNYAMQWHVIVTKTSCVIDSAWHGEREGNQFMVPAHHVTSVVGIGAAASRRLRWYLYLSRAVQQPVASSRATNHILCMSCAEC
jgi:hypothetical protein